MAHPPAKYKYDRITTKAELRIVTLKPSNDFDSEIVCELETLSRDQCGDYTALSYCWGTSYAGKKIKIKDGEFEVGDELAAALRYLRLKDASRRLWIDAICIIQDEADARSGKDKTAQVHNMDKTYRSATEVIVWLGKPDLQQQTSLAIRAIDELGEQLENLKLAAVPSANLVLPADINGATPKEYGRAILQLLQRPWFTRLWVIQEICLAPEDVKLVCGYDKVSFWKMTNLGIHPSMRGLFMSCWTVPTDNRHTYLTLEPPIALTRQYFVAERKGEEIWRATKSTLLSHLWNFRNRQCTKAIDRVYGLLGIACDIGKAGTERDEAGIEPDYTISADQAFAKATRAIILTQKRLDILGMCQGPDESIQRPSWVPDLDLRPTARPMHSLTVYMDSKPYFNATNGSKANPQFREDLSELMVDGHHVDTIQDLASKEGEDWAQALQRSRKLVQSQAAAGMSRYADVDNAYWRTLITNRNAYAQPASPNIEGDEFPFWWDNIFTDPRTRSRETEQTYINFQSAWLQYYAFRNFFVTKNGYMGLCPLAAKAEDCICLLSGSQVPFVLRKEAGRYRVVGECYLHDVMNGRRWKELEGLSTGRSTFQLF